MRKGGFRKDSSWGAGRRGVLDCSRCEGKADEGVTVRYFIFSRSLLSSHAAGLKPGTMESEGRSALGRVKPTPAHPGTRGIIKPLMMGCRKWGAFCTSSLSIALVCCWAERETRNALGSAVADVVFEALPQGKVSSAYPFQWAPHRPPAPSLAFKTICSSRGKAPGGPHHRGVRCLG